MIPSLTSGQNLPNNTRKKKKLSFQFVASNMTAKILKEAINQHKEIEEERRKHTSFSAVTEDPTVVLYSSDDEDYEEEGFDGFSETQSQYDGALASSIPEETDVEHDQFFFFRKRLMKKMRGYCQHSCPMYKNELTKDDKVNLDRLIQYQKHHLVTHEIRRELKNSRSRGQEDDVISIVPPVSVINKTIEEDRWDIPEVPMEKD